MEFILARASGTPLYRQIVDQVRDRIARGSLLPGDRLPTVRQLAATYKLTRLTVHSAYAELQAEGLIESHGARGTFVAAEPDGAAALPTAPSLPSRGRLTEILHPTGDQEAVSLAVAMPEPSLYPVQQIAAAAQRTLRDRDALGYGSIQGEPELRRQMSALLRERGTEVSPASLLVTGGAQQAIDLVFRALTGPRDVILTEEPTYPGLLEAAAQHGRRMVSIPRGEAGFDLDVLEAACRTYKPALLCVIPTYGNPTGTSLPPQQRSALLELARRHDFRILEDDVYGLLWLDGPADPPLLSADSEGQVVYLTSLSKTLSPSLRLGVIAAADAQLAALADAKEALDLVTSMLLQRMAAEYLRTGQLRPHLDSVRGPYQERRDAMLGALARHLPGCTWTHPAGGLSLWVTLPPTVDERDFFRDALDAGVHVAPGRAFFPQPRRQGYMRLSYGMQSPESIERGVAALGRVLERHRAQRGALSLAGRAAGPLV